MKKFMMVALAAMGAVPAVAPQAAYAQSNADQNHAYRGNDGHYRQDCKHSSGTTGLVAGGVAGGVAVHVLGGRHTRDDSRGRRRCAARPSPRQET